MRNVMTYLNGLRRELVGFVMGSAPLAIFGIVEHYRGRSIAWSLYGAAVLSGFFVAGYRVWAEERKRAIKAEAGPRLQLHFDHSRPPYVEDLRKKRRVMIDEDSLGPSEAVRVFRVRVANIGSDTAEQVRAVLDSIEPLPKYSPLSLPLHFMDCDRTPTAIPPGGSVFVDVLLVSASEVSANYAVQFDDPKERHWHQLVDTVFCLRMEGGRAPVRGRYRLSLDSAGQPAITEIGA